MIIFDTCAYEDSEFKLVADLEIARHSFVAVIGPSGAGKSTLLNLIAGFEELQSGDISIDGKTMRDVPPNERPVGMVFQDHNCFAHLNAFQNVALGISPRLKLSDAQNDAVEHALKSVGIAHLAKRRPGEMSGGERQRIALARVLVRNKPVLLLDEAFAALGPGLRKEMMLLVRDLHTRQNMTTLMVTHQPEDAVVVADQIIFVSDGKVHTPQNVDQFLVSSNPVVRKYLGT